MMRAFGRWLFGRLMRLAVALGHIVGAFLFAFRVARKGNRRVRVRTRIPIRSTKRDAKRQAHRYANQIAGRDMSWKKARRMMNRLERDGRAQERLQQTAS